MIKIKISNYQHRVLCWQFINKIKSSMKEPRGPSILYTIANKKISFSISSTIRNTSKTLGVPGTSVMLPYQTMSCILMDVFPIILDFINIFLLLLIVHSWLLHDSCYVCFFISFLLPFSLVPLIKHPFNCACYIKISQKSGFCSLLCRFPWKRESAFTPNTL